MTEHRRVPLAEQMKNRITPHAVPVTAAFTDTTPPVTGTAPVERPEVVVTSIALPAALHATLRRTALTTDRHLNDLLLDAAHTALTTTPTTTDRHTGRTQRTSLTLPTTLHKQLRIHAFDHHTTLTALLTTALEGSS